GRPRAKTTLPCYTYDGPAGTTLDSEISAELAKACGYQHAIVRIEPDFFAEFADHTDRTVYLTDGYFGATGAHEVYLSAAARSIAPIRLTGVFGGEVFRGVSTFKPLGLDEGLFAPDVADNVATRISQLRTEDVHPVTAAAFTRLPQTLHGSLTACRSQLTFRTPYLDNEIVKLAYSTPPELRGSSLPAVRMLAKKDPELARIATDMGELGRDGGISALLRRSIAKTTFKLDYLRNDGMPHWAASAEPILDAVNRRARIFGRHKYLRYRQWFRRELADYVRDALASASVQRSALWNSDYVRSVAQTHVEGRRNCVQEINAILTVDAVERLLLAPARAASLETAAELEPATTASVA
ncbi:MAG TPA: asparagine synthase-related protein, partial [Chthoniobacterales bacterium]